MTITIGGIKFERAATMGMIMRKAHDTYNMRGKFGTPHYSSFGEALKRAWLEIKLQLAELAVKVMYGLENDMEFVSSSNGKVVVRVHYSAYKNKYEHLQQVRGSYNNRKKTIALYLTGSPAVASGVCPRCMTYCDSDCYVNS
jgi:hypothetical protein